MLQVRKLVLAIAAATSFTSSVAHALGLGQMSVKSSLNQPLNAEIELLEVKNLNNIDLRAGLASAEDFARAGVDRQFFLTGLKFTPVVAKNGKSYIRVTSNQPVKEPYLNFMVEVMWPEGRLLREYTALLDPPSYKPQAVVRSQAPHTAQSGQQARPATSATTPEQSVVIMPSARPKTSQTAARPARQTRPQAGTKYKVRANDRLWNIASSIARGANIEQTMLAIQDLNPDAFVDGNINRLKVGAVLDLPTAEQAKQRSRTEALQQVQAQAQDWRTGQKTVQSEPTAARTVDATRVEEPVAAPTEIEKEDNLRLVADQGEANVSGDSERAAAGLINDQLALARESLDSSRLQNQELQDRVKDLESQLEKLQKLIELKDAQLAGIQEGLVNEPGSQAGDIDESQQPAENELPVTEPVDTSVTEPEEGSVETDSPSVIDQPEEQSELDEQPEEQLEPELEPEVATAPEPATEQQTVAEPISEPEVEPQTEESFISGILANPLLVAALGGGLLLLLLLLIKRRRDAEATEVYDDFDMLEDAEEEFDQAVDSERVAATTGVSGAAFYQQAVAQEAEEVDVLDQVEWFFAQGSYIQAGELLEKAIEVEPGRLELQEKLAEAYGYLGNVSAFQAQLTGLEAAGLSVVDINRLKQQFPDLMHTEESADDVFALNEETALPPMAEFDLGFEPLSSTAGFQENTHESVTAELEQTEDDFGAMLDAIQVDEPTTLAFDDQGLSVELGRMEATVEELNESLEQATNEVETDDLETAVEQLTIDPVFEAQQEVEADLTRMAESMPEEVEAALDFEDMSFLANTDMVDTKLSLATTYIDMGEIESARSMLQEVIQEGNSQQKDTAEQFLASLG